MSDGRGIGLPRGNESRREFRDSFRFLSGEQRCAKNSAPCFVSCQAPDWGTVRRALSDRPERRASFQDDLAPSIGLTDRWRTLRRR